jgi:hypothetical protein
MQKKKDVTDSEIEQAMKPVLADLSRHLVKREIVKEEEPEQPKQKKKKPGRRGSRKSGQRRGNASGSQGDSEQKAISDDERGYMESIIDEPNLSVTARAKRLGLSADKSTKLRNGLIAKALVHEFSVDLGMEFGGRVKMLRLTDDGYKALGETPPKPLPKSQGSLEHIWWQVHIANDYAERGYRANIERQINGKAADVGVSNGKEIVAVEVELSPKNVVYNLKADIDAGFSRVIVACKNQRIKNESERQIKSFIETNPSYEGKYKVVLLKEFPFVRKLFKEIRGE